MPLTASQVFAPLQSGVVPGVTPLNVAPNTWLANLVANAALQSPPLPVTGWNSGGVAWTEFLDIAAQFELGDANASIFAQAGFLDFCASGTVTYVNAIGATVTVPVSPDPSIPSQNPNAVIGWMDVIADSVYGIGTGNADGRLKATSASFSLQLVNTTVSSLGTYAAGTFHVANSLTGATYKNFATFTYSVSAVAGTTISTVTSVGGLAAITTSTAHGLSTNANVYVSGVPGLTSNWASIVVTGANSFTMTGVVGGLSYVSGGQVWIPQNQTFVADQLGPSANAAPGQVTITTTSVPGGYVDNVTSSGSGAPWESNIALAARCRASLQSAYPNGNPGGGGAKGAYFVAALGAAITLAAQTPPKVLTSAITAAIVTQTLGAGSVVTVIANASGPVPGVANLQVTGATGNAVSPIALAVPSTTGITTGMVGIVAGVNGNTAANGYWTLTVVDGTHVSLNGSTGNGAWTTGGVVEAGDLGLVDSVLQAIATPNAVTSTTQTVTNLVVNIVATVFVKAQFVTDFNVNSRALASLQAFIPTIAIGGTLLPGASAGVVDISAISDTIFNSAQVAGASYGLSVQGLTLNGVAQSLVMGANQRATIGTVAINTIGV